MSLRNNIAKRCTEAVSFRLPLAAQKRQKILPCGRILAFVNRSDVLPISNGKTARSARKCLVKFKCNAKFYLAT